MKELSGNPQNASFMKKYIFTFAILALGLTACNKETDSPQETPVENEVAVYQVSIPASMGAETKAVDFSGTDPVTGKPTAVSSFTTSDKIHVYNQTKDAMLTGYLMPSADGKTCDLTGTLTGTIEKGDELVLLYNLSDYDSDKTLCNFDYDSQDGTQAGVTDGAMATVTVDSYTGSGVLTTTTTAHFQNVQSMFRFQFTSNGTPVSVKSLAISSKKNALSNFYKPLYAGYKFCTDIPVTLSSATTNPIYVALCIKESVAAGDVLTFDVVDADNKLYTTTKDAPSTGFVNGKYYYNSSAIDLGDYKLQLVKPTLSRSDGGYDSELADADALRHFDIYSPSLSGAGAATGINMNMSGTSTGYWFYLSSGTGNTMNMSGLTATNDDGAYYIFSEKNLTLNISGDNTISCKSIEYCVAVVGDLKLSGNGTLTVTDNSTTFYGLVADNYGWSGTSDPSALAADGYTVTRSDMTDNGNGTYSWTYTVIPGTKFVNLSNINSDYEAQDGDILTGTLTGNYKISIADGATVTLADVNITNLGKGCYYAGITCFGDATLLLSGSNSVMGGMSDGSQGLLDGTCVWPGIFVPSGKTLTIDGTGSLDARSNGINENNKQATGIGGDRNNGCGNIVIRGGTVVAHGGNNSPGIGGNRYGGGYITITGSANVTATGGQDAAGIGSGHRGTCGDITISTTGKVTAQGGGYGAGIGSGYESPSQCGKIIISEGTIEATGGYKGAGIGSGMNSTCGDITISTTGTVTAQGGFNGPGIGSGVQSTCGTITITDGVTSVTATKGNNSNDSIGRGNNGTCGTVTVGGTVFWGPNDNNPSWYEYKNGGGTYLRTSPLTYQP